MLVQTDSVITKSTALKVLMIPAQPGIIIHSESTPWEQNRTKIKNAKRRYMWNLTTELDEQGIEPWTTPKRDRRTNDAKGVLYH